MKLYFTLISLLAALSIVPASATTGSVDPHSDDSANGSKVPLLELRVFAEALERIRNSYIEDIDDKTLLESAIRGMLQDLDPHSTYLIPEEFSDLQVNTSGEFGGLGIEIQTENGFVRVVSPIDDTPASRAGLKAGDLILKVDDTIIKGLSLNEVVNMLRGQIGTKVRLSILSSGDEKPRDVELERARIITQSVRSQVLDNHYGYLRVTQFQNHSASDVAKHIKKLLEEQQIRGLVLDLRNNPGGVLNGAVQIADLFLNEGIIVYTQGRTEDTRVNFNAASGDLLDGKPIVVLINAGSASASEIVAGALQDHGRALVVGQRSFGKGSVQSIMPLYGERAIKLTTALYYTPNGRSIQAEGIEPDVEIPLARIELQEASSRLREANLRHHLNNASGKNSSEKTEQSASEDNSESSLANHDFALYQALSILKGMALQQTGTR